MRHFIRIIKVFFFRLKNFILTIFKILQTKKYKTLKNINLPRNLKKIIIISADVICIFFSVFIAFSLRLEIFYSPFAINITVYFLFLIIIIGVNFFLGIYDTVIRFLIY